MATLFRTWLDSLIWIKLVGREEHVARSAGIHETAPADSRPITIRCGNFEYDRVYGDTNLDFEHHGRMPARMKRYRLDSPHSRSANEVLATLDVSLASGLSEDEARQRLLTYGPNAIGSRQKARLIFGPAASIQEPCCCSAGLGSGYRALLSGMGGRRGHRWCLDHQYRDRLRDRDQGNSIDRGHKSARKSLRQSASRRQDAHDRRGATGPWRHRLARCRRCHLCGPAVCGSCRSRRR